MDTDCLEVKDLSLAAYLYSVDGINLVGKRNLPNGSLIFQFSPKEKADNLIALYWKQQAPLIQPKKLFGSLRDLKDIIFGG